MRWYAPEMNVLKTVIPAILELGANLLKKQSHPIGSTKLIHRIFWIRILTVPRLPHTINNLPLVADLNPSE
jgi:hypothetical protein